MLAIGLGLASSVFWGLADFAGGLQSRRLPLLAVMLFSQAAGLAALLVAIAVWGGPPPGVGHVAAAVAAGAAGTLALSAFYRALAIGTMSIVAPISATGAAVPVIVGLATGEHPGIVRLAGIGAAGIGVVLASREAGADAERAASARASVGLALFAALGFGAFFVGMQRAAGADVLWALLVARLTAVVLLAAFAAAVRTNIRVAPAGLRWLLAIGALDVSANALYAVGSTQGLLSVVAVLGSLYPVTTILMARALLGERIRRVQELGVAAVLAGVVLLAAG